jgi:hypothetical protein
MSINSIWVGDTAGVGLESFMWGGQNTFCTSSEGTLFIDLIDAKKKELVWQGEGISYLNQNRGDKEKRINEFVAAILKQYPPQTK